MVVDNYVYSSTNILKNKFNIMDKEQLEKKEEQLFEKRYKEIIRSKIDIKDKIEMLKYINKYLFSDIYEFAGSFRTIDIEKEEMVLNGLSMNYSKANLIEVNLLQVFNKYSVTTEMKKKLSLEKLIERICMLTANIWKVHPFRDCNTRTIITFIIKYLEEIGIIMKNELFESKSTYLRDALIAASYEDREIGVYPNLIYLYKIVKNSIIRIN